MNESKLSPRHNPEDVIIVIMDLQERLLPSIQNKDNLVDSNKILIQASALLELPIVVTEQVPEKLDHTIAGLFKKWI